MFDSFSLYQTNVLFSKSGSIKTLLWLWIKWSLGQAYYDYRQNNVFASSLSSASKFYCMSQSKHNKGNAVFWKADRNLKIRWNLVVVLRNGLMRITGCCCGCSGVDQPCAWGEDGKMGIAELSSSKYWGTDERSFEALSTCGCFLAKRSTLKLNSWF